MSMKRHHLRMAKKRAETRLDRQRDQAKAPYGDPANPFWSMSPEEILHYFTRESIRINARLGTIEKWRNHYR
jgi:hypothetical protein